MVTGDRAARRRFGLLVALAGGWFAGLVAQRSIVEATGYLDIPPPLLVLGSILCVLAGVASWAIAPQSRRRRTGAFAGIAMMASMVAGYALLAVAYRDRFSADTGGETWSSLLLEAWFWIGVPIAVSAGLGALGWIAAGRWLGDAGIGDRP